MSDADTIHPERLASIRLSRGSHESPKGGLCYNEAKAYVWGLPHSDKLDCMSPVLSRMGIRVNDLLPDGLRQRLIPLLSVSPDSVDDGLDEARGYMVFDWLVRTWLPASLDLAPTYRRDAATLRALDRIVDLTSAKRAGRAIRQPRSLAAAIEKSTSNDAWGSDWDGVAEDAAWGVAAWDAAWGVATWSAVRDAAMGSSFWADSWDNVKDDVKDVFQDAAWDAWVIARHAARDAWLASRDAARFTGQSSARNIFVPAGVTIHESLIELYAVMTRLGAE